MTIKKISLYIFFIPTITVILSYILSLNLNLVPYCIPIFDGCTSISRTGRYFPVNIFFKSFMFLTGILIIKYWHLNFQNFKVKSKLLLINYAYVIGLISIFFLFLYLVFLGENNYYRFFRKVGIFIYILFSIIAELILAIIYYKKIKYFNINFTKLKLCLSIFLVLLGIILFPFMIMKLENVSEIRNIVSWNYFFLIQINYLITFLVWKK